MKKETQQILDDLKKRGLDISSIENQIRVNPTIELAADDIIGGGVLRQSQYTYLANQAQEEKKRLEDLIKQTATAHDQHSFISPDDKEKYEASLEYIAQLEQGLISTGQFSEESIREASFAAGKGLKELISKADPVNGGQPNNQPVNKGVEMPANLDPNKTYVDSELLNKSVANMGMGNAITNMMIMDKRDEVKRLGIDITPEQSRKLQENLARELMSNERDPIDAAFEKTFELSKVREAAATKAFEDRIKNERAAERAEVLKEVGVPARSHQRNHLLLDRHAKIDSAVATARGSNVKGYEDSDGNIDPSKLPINKQGDVEVFRLRGTREGRINRAAQLMNKIEEHNANDPTYVD